jgi:N6-adenosine-specific RNA methylase IME4
MHSAAIEVDLQLCYPSPKARAIDSKSVKALAASIEQIGLLNPVVVRRIQKSRAGQMCEAFEIVAGMHRVKAMRQLERSTIPAVVIEADDLHAELMLIDENLQRAELTPAERASANARRKAIWQELHPETRSVNERGGPGRGHKNHGQVGHGFDAQRYDEAAAEETGQSERTIRRDVQRGEALGDAALAKVARTSLDKGDELDALAKLPEEKRADLIERAAGGEKVSAKTEAKKDHREKRERDLGVKQRALPDKKYGIILADPEWRFETYSAETGMDRAADNHYPTSDTLSIITRPVATIAADDCVLFLWATVPMLPQALRVMHGWGFEYKSHAIWKKDRQGTGYWFRNLHELLLVGTKGKPPAPAMGTQAVSVFDAPVGEHSAKPEVFLEEIERHFPTLPKIELNRRGPARAGWDAWGNEASTEILGEAAE